MVLCDGYELSAKLPDASCETYWRKSWNMAWMVYLMIADRIAAVCT